MHGHRHYNPVWTWAIPLASLAALALSLAAPGLPGMALLLTVALMGAVVCAVHHAEVIALQVGEPFGTLVLALSITVIEVALIVSMMLSGGEGAMGLPRDTLFAAVMIILNGIIGLSLLMGGRVNRVQRFNVEGMTDALAVLTVIVVLAMVLPNFLVSAPGPVYSPRQLVFSAVATLVLFVAFTLFQTVGHRDYFLQATSPGSSPGSSSDPGVIPTPCANAAPGAPEVPAQDTPVPEPHKPGVRTTWFSTAFLLVSLVGVVANAKAISPTLEALLGRWGAPATALGIIIAAIVLLPEFGAALRAARANRLQTSLNLAMGSAIASIGLTIPVVSLLAVYMGWPLELGLQPISMAMLALTLFVVALSLRTGHTTTQPGVVHVVLFAVYLFFSFVL